MDTLHLFNAHADTIRLGFEDTLHIAATDSDAFRYAYRWNINGQDASEDNALDLFLDASGENALVFFQEPSGENALDFSFSGQRKNKITGSRIVPSGHSYHFYITDTDIVFGKHRYYLQEATDTVYLEAFSDYANDPDASWLWIVNGDTLPVTGPQVRLTATKEAWLHDRIRVDCYFQIGNEEDALHTFAYIDWEYSTGRFIYLPENKDGHFYHLYVFNQDFDRIYAHPNDTLCLEAWMPDEFYSNTSFTRPTKWNSFTLTREELKDTSSPSQIVFFRGIRDRDYLEVSKRKLGLGEGRRFFIHWGNAEIETD
ncbi:MAG: hypothetical protein K2J57_05185, partial [Bacteroidales bacterium]|nr:hypothetical protein [Bacteroidales bacterium]